MKSKQVILKGGLGNQLFQWGFAHYVQSLGYEVSLIAYKPSRGSDTLGSYSQRYSAIENLMRICTCIKLKTYSLSIPIYRGVRDVQSARHPLRKMQGFYKNFDSNPFQLVSNREIHNIRNFSGYFQNQKYIKEVEEILFLELKKYLDSKTKFGEKIYDETRNVLHARRGDYAVPSHFFNIGILSSSYYERAKNLVDEGSWIALSDDPQNIYDVTSKLQIETVLGPKELDTVAALSKMGNSRNLIISNSTLAWWGGFLSVHQGGRVFAPTPWFRKDMNNQSRNIIFKEFETVPAEFLMDLKEYESSRSPY